MSNLTRIALRSFLLSLTLLLLQSGVLSAAEKKSKQAKPTAAASASTPIAKVNGTVITRSELDRAVKIMLAQNRQTQPLTDEQKKSLENALTNQLISAELLYQAGRKYEIKDVDKQIENLVAQRKAKFPSPEEFQKWSRENGLTDKDLKEFARKEIYINNLVEKDIVPKATVTEAEAKKFYDENPDKFKNPETVKASHILVGTKENDSAADKATAKAKAEALLKRVKAGEDFAEVAKKESSCPSAAQGGDLGYFGKGQMVPEFENAAFGLKPGEVSGIVETKFGYHIIKLVEKKPAGTVTFAESQQMISEYLKTTKIQAEIGALVEKLRKDAKIETMKL
jgi:peptidyl-prolyl cis-trans isomerase C